MTLPSQFSLEEENFYKDIQDLVKNGSQNEKELSSFLQRYMDLLARADLDDETFIINFTKAGLIIEASAKVYGTKVDRLWLNLEHVLESLKNKNQGQSKKKLNCEDGEELDVEGGCDDDDDGKRKLPHSRRRKKVGDAFFSVDDFLEIDNTTGLLGKNMNETGNKENKLKLCEKVPTMFIKNKRKKKKIDVCLNKCVDDKDVIRLRDWVIDTDCLLIKEIYTPRPEDIVDSTNITRAIESRMCNFNEESVDCDDNVAFENMDVDPVHENEGNESLKDEQNNNTEVAGVMKECLSESKITSKMPDAEPQNDFVKDLEISKESDMAKFPNVLNRVSGDCLVDVDEVFWNTSKFHDVIPSKKLRAGKTNKAPCQLCADKKAHKKRGKRCIEDKKLESLDSYFTPHVQPTVTEPHFGIRPDEDLYSIFKMEMKLIEQLGKVNSLKNINDAYHPDESPEELRNFLGFDGFEHRLMKRTTELQEDELLEENLRLENDIEDDHDNYAEDPPPTNEFELPFPVTVNTVSTSILLRENELGPKDDEHLANSESEYQKLVIEELKDHYAAKTSFAKNKELGMKISKWHDMIADKIKLSQKRGALNMNSLAGKIMNAFSSTNTQTGVPKMPFKELVRNQTRRDIPRYFFACLQLTNEGNLDISKSSTQPLTTDCMIITQLRSSRANYELDESTVRSPQKEVNSSRTQETIGKKRSSICRSPSILDSKNLSKKKKVKQKIVKSHKRPKNFNSVNNSKRRRCSISSADSFASE